MDNSCRTAMAAAVAGGYLLGRTKKAKLALGLAMFAAGRRLKLSPGDLAAAGMRQLVENPQLAGLRDQVRGDLLGAAKTAAAAAMDRQVSSLTDSLRERSEALAKLHEQGGPQEDEEGAEDEEGEDEEASQEADEDEDYEDEDEEGGDEDEEEAAQAARPRPKKRAPAKKAAAAKKAPAKKAAAKKTAARRSAKSGR